MGTLASYLNPDECYEPRMTRAEALARRAAGTLKENCVVVITDGPVIGNTVTSPTEIELNPVSPTELGLTARVHQNFDDSAWAGIYDIDLGVAGSITRLEDSSGNVAVDQDADSPTVHTQFPWHLGTTIGGTWRDNYVEDTTFTAADTVIAPMSLTNNRFINTTMDFTGWTIGSISDTLVQGAGTHKVFGVSIWQRSNIIQATVNAVTERINLTGSDVVDAVTSISTTGNGDISLTNSRVEDGAIILNAGEQNITLTNSNMREAAQIQNDPGSQKSFNINQTEIDGQTIIRGQGGTTTRTVSFFNTSVSGKPVAGDTMIFLGDAAATILHSDIIQTINTWSIDGNTTTTALQWNNVRWFNGSLTHGPLAGNCQWGNSDLRNCVVDVQGPGTAAGFAVSINTSDLFGVTIRHSAGVTESMSITSTTAIGGGGGAVIAMDNATPRGLSMDGGNNFYGPFSIIQTGTTAPSDLVGSNDDRVFNCSMRGGAIEFATTVGGVEPHVISRCGIYDGPGAPGFAQGLIRIDGTSEHVFVESCEVHGELIITDAPEGALSEPTSMYGNFIGAGSALHYTGGDAVEKQIRENRIEGNASLLDCVGLTGTAGAALADVFTCRVANQSILTVTGARVPGFPVRSVIAENAATVTIDPNGSALQFRAANNADFTSGAFTHLDSEISGDFVHVAAAANLNRLFNKGFNDFV